MALRARSLENLTPFIVLIAVWQLAAAFRIWPPAFLPPPLQVYKAGQQLLISGTLATEVARTAGRVATGAALGFGIGVALAVLFVLLPRMWDALEDVVNYLQAVGEIGWLPVFALWLGFNETTITITIAYTVFFPVFFGTFTGFRSVPPNLIASVRTLGGGTREVVTDVLIPGALPGIITGLRTGMGFGWRTVILAEFVVAQTGLGVLLLQARQFFRTDIILVGMIVAGLLWLATDRLLLQPLERRTVERWGMQRKPA